MQITHQEARKLIQFSLDQTLMSNETELLRAHIERCPECRGYADDMKEVERIVVPLMKQQWTLQPTPLSTARLIKEKRSNRQSHILLATRTTMVSLIFAAFLFSAWQFTHSNRPTSTPMPVNILPIPTPSGQLTTTIVSVPTCEEIIYQVQESDTLASIARQFSVSKDEIMAVNNLNSETIAPKMDLLIPICSSTPTSTSHPSTMTITFTPLLSPTLSTPGN